MAGFFTAHVLVTREHETYLKNLDNSRIVFQVLMSSLTLIWLSVSLLNNVGINVDKIWGLSTVSDETGATAHCI